ncbi:ATP-binding protein [Streptomyces sp. NPDC001586]|uniref:ATP-binding protein n=1 Tax=Streptomyces sp. NPDC001586 TaxID=3154387 RepID=UPI0033175639
MSTEEHDGGERDGRVHDGGERDGGGTVLGVVVERYESPEFPPLTGATRQLRDLCDLLAGYGFTPTVVTDPGRAELGASVARWRNGWADGGTHGPAVVVWSGHGKLVAQEPHAAELHLIVRDTRRSHDEEETYSARRLASAALECGADRVLVLIDTCHAGAGVLESLRKAFLVHAQRSLPPGRAAWFGVVASCRPQETADGTGLLVDAVTRVLREGPAAGGYRHEWSRRNREVTGAAVLDAVQEGWPADAGQQPLAVTLGRDGPMFPNPRVLPGAEAELVEHLVRAARGAERVEEGWFFTGRRRVLAAIVAWLEAGEPGLFLVTGSAGSGKSAVLGRISTLSSERYRADVIAHGALRRGDPDPGVRRVAASVHVRGLTVRRLADSLAAQLHLDPPAAPSALIADIEREGRRPVLVVDGLDEAAPEHAAQIVDELLAPLSRMALVLLGSRDRPFRPGAEPGESLGRAVTRLLDARATTADLDEEPGTAEDIREYARLRLLAEGVPGEHAADAADAVAERAVGDAGGFLFAGLAVGALSRRFAASGADGWQDALPVSIAAGFTADLAGGPDPARARDLLTALAWSHGNGIPARGIWEAVASALSPSGTSYGPQDVDWVLNAHGRYVVEDSDGTQAVYRLYHREFAAWLMGPDEDPDATVKTSLRVLHTLIGLLPEGSEAPNPYLPGSIPASAMLAGEQGPVALRALADSRGGVFRALLAEVLMGLCAVLQHFGQGADALPSAREAAEILRALVREDPQAHLSRLLTALNHLAMCQDGPGAVASTAEAVALHRRLVGASGAHRAELAMSLHNLALYTRSTGDTGAALESAAEAVRIYEVLAGETPESHTEHLARALITLGARQGPTDPREGVRTCARAVELYEALARDAPTAHREDLADALIAHSQLLGEVRDLQGAVAEGRRAVDVLRDVTGGITDAHRIRLASALGNLGVQQAHAGDSRGALASCTTAVGLLRTSGSGRHPAPDLFMRLLANLAREQEKVDDVDGALASITEAVGICRDLAEHDPRKHGEMLTRLSVSLAAHLCAAGRLGEAAATSEEAVRDSRELAARSPVTHLPGLTLALSNLAIIRSRLGDSAGALAAGAEAVALARSLARDDPDAHLPQFAETVMNQCVELSAADPEAALAAAREALEVYRVLVGRHPGAHTEGLARTLTGLGTLLWQRGEREEALAATAEAVELLRRLVRENPGTQRPLLAEALARLAEQSAETGATRAALDAAAEAVELTRALAAAGPASYRAALPARLCALGVFRAAAADTAGALAAVREGAELALAPAVEDPASHLGPLAEALGLLGVFAPPEEVLGAHLRAEAALAGVPGAAWLTCQRGSFQLSLPDAEPGVRTLLALASPRHPAGDPENRPTLYARQRLRAYRPLVSRLLGGAVPPWLPVRQELVELAGGWVASADWATARAVWEEYAVLLSTPHAGLALEELALADGTAGLYLAVAREAARSGAAAAFGPYLVRERLEHWMALPTWEESRAYLTAHAADLARARTPGSVGAPGASDPERVHQALLVLAAATGISAAYACVADPDALRERWRRELAVAEPDFEVLAGLCALEECVHGQGFAAGVHLRTAHVLAGRRHGSIPSPAPTPAEREAAVAELAGLIPLRAGHAAELGALISGVLGGFL